jgi:hypothetical protein
MLPDFTGLALNHEIDMLLVLAAWRIYKRAKKEMRGLKKSGTPSFPHMHRVTPCSSSSSSAGSSGLSSVDTAWASTGSSEEGACLLFSFGFRRERPLVVLWAELEEALDGAWFGGLRSTGKSSKSSSFVRFPRLPLLWESSGGRCGGGSLGREPTSESGDLEVLVDAECWERLPERRVSLGERGGPMEAAWAMAERAGWCVGGR